MCNPHCAEHEERHECSFLPIIFVTKSSECGPIFEFSLAYDALFSTMIENSLRILQIQNHFRTKGGLDLLKKKNVHKGERIVMSNTQNHSVLYTM